MVCRTADDVLQVQERQGAARTIGLNRGTATVTATSAARTGNGQTQVPFRRAWEELLSAASAWPPNSNNNEDQAETTEPADLITRPTWRPGGIGYVVPFNNRSNNQQASSTNETQETSSSSPNSSSLNRNLRRIRPTALQQHLATVSDRSNGTMRSLLERFYGMRPDTTLDETNLTLEGRLLQNRRRSREEDNTPPQRLDEFFTVHSRNRERFTRAQQQLQQDSAVQVAPRLREPRERLERLRAMNLAAVFNTTDIESLDDPRDEGWVPLLSDANNRHGNQDRRIVRLITSSGGEQEPEIEQIEDIERPFC